MHLPENFFKQILSRIKILLLICIIYYTITWFTGCPIRYFTGISCPGCGMTRAWIAVLHHDFAQAFACHPLFFTAPIIVLGFIFEDWIDFKKYRWAVLLLGAAYLITYVVRMIWFQNEIMVWNPQSGVIFQTMTSIIKIL